MGGCFVLALSQMKLYKLSIILLVISLMVFLLWPLQSDTYAIRFSEEKIKRKKDWLNTNDYGRDNSLPNIIWIVVDDLGVADLSMLGMGKMPTPNMDRIGKDGVIFTNAFTTSPVCSPARAALLTGRYPQRFGFQYQMHDRYLKNRLEYLGFKYFVDSDPWVPKWMEDVPKQQDIELQGLPPSQVIMPEILKKKGYTTGLIGKWHLGNSKNQVPCEMGFDYQYGFYASNSLYIQENTKGYTDQKIPEDFTDKYIWQGQRNGPHAIYRNCELVEEDGYLTDRFTDEAIQFISQHANSPFFLMLAYNAPHTPLQAPDEYVNQFNYIKDPVKRVYQAMIKNLDDNIGDLFSFLEESSVDENTVIFFVSDNGGAEYTFTTDNGPYQGGKITDLEGGIRIPMAIKWKNHLVGGKIFTPQVSIMDIFQTTIDLTDSKPPDFADYDGVNLLPFIDSEAKGVPHPFLYWQRGPSKAVRSEEWKLVWNEDEQDTLLFNLKGSPFEAKNVLVSKKAVANDLISRHRHWSSDFPKPLWPSLILYRYHIDGHDFYFDQ